MILTAEAILGGEKYPTEEVIRKKMAGNLCRCGNYNSITKSVLAAAEMMKRSMKHG